MSPWCVGIGSTLKDRSIQPSFSPALGCCSRKPAGLVE